MKQVKLFYLQFVELQALLLVSGTEYCQCSGTVYTVRNDREQYRLNKVHAGPDDYNKLKIRSQFYASEYWVLGVI